MSDGTAHVAPMEAGRTRGISWRALGLLTLAAALVRLGFAAVTVVPSEDPWRHMALVRNLRAGLGFTLFDEQPYLWYPPPWYWLAALVRPEEMKWLAAGFSTLAVPLFTLYLSRALENRRAALAGGLALGLCGPLVYYTGQLGAEAFALCLLCAALLASTASGRVVGGATSGLLFGLAVVSRPQIGLVAPLFLPLLRTARSGLALVLGAALPLAALWLRNHALLEAHPIVFTWDGVATRAGDYDLLSTLLPQLHPTIVAANAELYSHALARGPEWLFSGTGRLRIEMLALVGIGLACVLASRQRSAILAALTTVVFLGFCDRTRSSWFERNWFGLLPVLCMGLADVAGTLSRRGWRSRRGRAGVMLLTAFLALGAPSWKPGDFPPVEMLTPPPEFLPEDAYLVAGGFFQPEALVWRFPEKRFIGLPRDPELLNEVLRRFPTYRTMLWHPFGADYVQHALFEHLRTSPRFRFAESTVNPVNYRYLLVKVF
jgi:hypothetical protein